MSEQVDCAVIGAGIAGLLKQFAIESPGLTASLAIADHVANLLN